MQHVGCSLCLIPPHPFSVGGVGVWWDAWVGSNKEVFLVSFSMNVFHMNHERPEACERKVFPEYPPPPPQRRLYVGGVLQRNSIIHSISTRNAAFTHAEQAAAEGLPSSSRRAPRQFSYVAPEAYDFNAQVPIDEDDVLEFKDYHLGMRFAWRGFGCSLTECNLISECSRVTDMAAVHRQYMG